jgi:hypothetical protein
MPNSSNEFVIEFSAEKIIMVDHWRQRSAGPTRVRA